jgi:hypothetical protein
MEGQNWLNTIPDDETVAIICPLYGYWSDLKIQQLNLETLKKSLENVVSQHHKSYLIIVAEADRTSKELQNWFATKNAAGNVLGVSVEKPATYGDYLKEGLDAALEETSSKFILVINPWIAVRETYTVDGMLERVNKMDANIVSAFDMRTYAHNGLLGVPDSEFLSFQFNPPMEIRDWNIDLWCATRQTIERLNIDSEYKTHYFIARDLWQTTQQSAIESMSSQNFPIYSFLITWTILESSEDYEHDKQHFIQKWHFDPMIQQ